VVGPAGPTTTNSTATYRATGPKGSRKLRLPDFKKIGT